MENGMYTAIKNDSTIHAVYVDQETLEFSQLNRKAQANRQKNEREQDEKEQHQKNQLAAAEKVWKAEEARKRKFRRVTAQTVKQEMCLAAAMAVVHHGFSAGLVSVFFAIPVQAVLLAVFCFKAGSFFGRIFRRRR